MIKFEHTAVYGWEAAIRGMRNPLNSWERSDTELGYGDKGADVIIGDNDHSLMMRLAKGGPVHAKYRRMITATVDITAPLYWWKEFDTYKVGTVANSCSTMHKITSKPIELSDFSIDNFYLGDDIELDLKDMFINAVSDCESLRRKYLETNDKRYWTGLIQLLPTSYNQKRTIQLNYEVLVGMYWDRRNHKLDEWHTFCDWIRDLPYSEIIIGADNEQSEADI